MSIRQLQIEIEPNEPFANCKLGRKVYADVLTNIVNTYSDGFVLAINNKWGTGKTTFVKMWEKDLQIKKFKTVYFNAWENDFDNNPLIALMGELKTIENKKSEKSFKAILKNAAIISKHVAPIVVRSLADKYVNTKDIQNVVEGVTKGMSEIFEKEVNEYVDKKKNIDNFRTSLSQFVANTTDGKPLIFIVDELDRCRPDYAVSILEQIKHFFSIPNIVFVLSIDKSQLGNAIRGVYGSEKIDADEYLRRFIDVEYSIPKPDASIYYNYLYEYFNFDEFFQSENRRKHRELYDDKRDFSTTCNLLFSNSTISLRQQEKIFTLARLSLRSFVFNNYVVPHIFLFLIYIKIIKNEFYDELKNKELTLQQAQSKFFDIIKYNLNEDTERDFIWLEVYFVKYYHNYFVSRYSRKKLFEYNKDLNKNELLIDCVTNKNENETFLNFIENMDRVQRTGDLDLGYFLNRIDLLENIKL